MVGEWSGGGLEEIFQPQWFKKGRMQYGSSGSGVQVHLPLLLLYT